MVDSIGDWVAMLCFQRFLLENARGATRAFLAYEISGLISKSDLLISRLRDSDFSRDFSRISQMRMRERSTAHSQTKKGCFSRDFLTDFS